MVSDRSACESGAVFCVFFGLNCKKELKITLFYHFLVIKFAHNKKAYYLCSVKINQPLKTYDYDNKNLHPKEP